jgi:hypothetical protein
VPGGVRVRGVSSEPVGQRDEPLAAVDGSGEFGEEFLVLQMLIGECEAQLEGVLQVGVNLQLNRVVGIGA